MKKYLAVKPVRADEESAGWMVVEEDIFSGFRDDLYRYGLLVALYNLLWMVFKQ